MSDEPTPFVPTWCVYCDTEFTTDGDTAAIRAHILTCPKHPLSAALAEVERLRAELRRFVVVTEGDNCPACNASGGDATSPLLRSQCRVCGGRGTLAGPGRPAPPSSPATP